MGSHGNRVVPITSSAKQTMSLGFYFILLKFIVRVALTFHQGSKTRHRTLSEILLDLFLDRAFERCQ